MKFYYSFHLKFISSAITISLLSGCGMWVRPYSAAPLPVLPESWQIKLTKKNQPAAATPPFYDNLWWGSFDDPKLNSLVVNALAANTDIKRAALRLRQAVIKQEISHLSFFPKPIVSTGIDMGRTWSRSSSSDINIPVNGVKYELPSSTISNVNKNFSLSGSISYELDFWGKLADQYAIDKSETRLAENEVETAKITLTTAVAMHYWNVAMMDKRIKWMEESLDDTKLSYNAVKARVEMGVAAAEVLRPAQKGLREKAIQLQKLQHERREQVDTLALLLDMQPGQLVLPKAQLPDPRIPLPDIEAGLPAVVLDHRPDLRAARVQLNNVLKQLNIAEKARYPQLTLNAGVSSSSEALRTLVSNPVGSLGMNLLLPAIEWGTLKRNRESSQLQYTEAVMGFRNTLYKALVEVEGNMRRYEDAVVALAEAHKALELADRKENFARERYQKGYTARQAWLDEREQKRSAAEAVAQSHVAQLESWITLRKALGRF